MNDFPAVRSQPLQDELDLIFRSFRLDGKRIIRTSTGEEVKWSLNTGGYPIVRAGSRKDSSRRRLLLHRVNFALTHGWLPVAIDHIDGDRLNYAIANLRPCTPSENMANSLYLGKPLPKSGLRNVVLLPSGRFGAKVSQGGMSHWLGTFETADEAKQAVEPSSESIAVSSTANTRRSRKALLASLRSKARSNAKRRWGLSGSRAGECAYRQRNACRSLVGVSTDSNARLS